MRKRRHRLAVPVFALLPLFLLGATIGAAAQDNAATAPPADAAFIHHFQQQSPPATPRDAVRLGPDGHPVPVHYRTMVINTRPGQAKMARAKAVSIAQPKQAAGAQGVKHGAATVQPFGSKGEMVSIAFNSGEFMPPAGEKLDPRLAILAQARTAQATASVYALILLNGRLDPATTAFLDAQGVRRLGFYPHAAYLARIPASALAAVASFPSVRWIGQPTVTQKLSPELRTLLNSSTLNSTTAQADAKLSLVVSFFGPDDDGAARNGLRALGASLGYYDARIAVQTVDMNVSQLSNLARMDSVLYIEPVRTGHTMNVFGMSTINADWLWGNYDPASDNTATQVKVGLLDSGFYVYHQDFSNLFVGSSVLGYSLVSGENWYDDLDHHGTHVSGTLLGEGNADYRYRGVAAGLKGRNNAAIPDYLIAQVFDKTGHGSGSTLIQGLDLLDLGFSSGYQRQVENFSGGGYGASGSDPEARKVDSVYGDGVLVCVAAGNNGPGNVGTPGDAKGALTVGAIYNNTEAGVFTDKITGYSALGPTSNGLHKPDVVSPGSYVDSTLAGTSNGYLYDWEGTSMATPHVTGLAASLIGHFGMPAWAVKSTIMANGIDLGYGRDTQGLGKVDALLNHYAIDGNWNTHWAGNGGNGDVQYFDIHLTQPVASLRVVMTYPDPPSAPGATSILVNDLDLYVQYSADGSTLTTDRSGSWADVGVDPVSVVQLYNMPAGYYRIKMYSYNVPTGSQAWAATAKWVNSTLNPNINFNVSVPYAVQPNNTFYAKATATSSGYVASGVVGSIAEDASLNLTGVYYFRQSKPSSSNEAIYLPNPWSSGGYYEVPNLNMGNIGAGNSRQMWWTLVGTSEGAKNVTFSVNSVNGGSGSTSGTVIVDGTPPSLGTPVSQNWTPSLTCDVTCSVQDSLSGLDPSTALYQYSTNGGSTWSGWISAACTGSYATTAAQTITAYGVAFGQNSASQNKIQFAAADAAGNYGYSAITSVSTATPSTLSISPNPVVGGLNTTGTLTLTGAAPTGGATVALSNTNPAAVVPATVVVAGGANTATFTITTSAVTANKTGTVKATYGGASASTTLTVRPVSVATLTLSPTEIVGGAANSTATVTLETVAPAGGLVVTLSSNTAAATVPASILIPAGGTSKTFTVTSHAVVAYTLATITASANSRSKSAVLTVAPAGSPGLTLTPTSVIGGVANSVGKITLPGAAPTGGIVFTLSSSNAAAASVPGSITIPAGATSNTFTVTSHKVTASASATITAHASVGSPTATLSVQPDAIISLSLSPTTVIGGSANSVGTVTLQATAPAGGVVVTLSSSNAAAATVPGSITIPAGATSKTFTVTSHAVASNTSATIKATSGGASKTAVLTVNH